MASADDLARFQASLLELLAQDLPADVMQRRLQEGAAFGEFRSYVGTFEPRMLAVAADLVKKWGKRANSDCTSDGSS